MRISKLKIFGFKSFAQKTEITFPGNGLTAVVGPNGCGKSNIVDAIRWVLGEQKAAILRMGKMQDVIFSGTEERAAMSLAEVSLIINNDDGSLPLPYAEIMVTRRAHRNGTSEYLINNQECRLKDIQNLFFDSGLGTGTYSQMNERMINAVLSDKAEDRRALFEEAAGVSKYKQQRKETLRQLERVQVDMARVEDNLNSTRRSVRQYEKQAEKTREWMDLRNRLRELDLSLSLDKYEDNKKSVSILDTSRKRVEHDLESSKTRLTVLKAQIDEKRLAISDDENGLRDLEQAVQKEELSLNNMNNDLKRFRELAFALEESSAKYNKEIEESREKQTILRTEKDLLEEKTAHLGSDDEMEEQLRLLEKEREVLQVLRNAYDDSRKSSQELAEKRIQALNKANSLRSRWQRTDTEKDLLLKDIESRNKEFLDLEEQKKEAQSNLDAILQGISDAERERELLEERRQIQAEKIESSKEDLLELEKRLQNYKNEEMRMQSRLDVLSSMAVSEGEGAKWLLENKSQEIAGLLGQQIEADPRYVSQIEFALGEALDAVLLQDSSRADALLTALEQASVGNVLLASFNGGSHLDSSSIEGDRVIGPAYRFISASDNIRLLLERWLSKWILVEDFETACRLAKEHASKDLWFLSPGRAVHTAGFIRACGKASESLGVLSRKTEITELQSALEQNRRELESVESSYNRNQDLLEEDQSIMNSLLEDIRESENQAQSGNAAKSIHLNSIQNIDRQLERIENERSKAFSRISTMEAERSEDSELKEAESLATQMEDEYQKMLSKAQEQELMYRNKESDIREIETRLGEKRSLITASASRLKSIAEQLSMLEELILNREQEIESIDIKVSQIKEDSETHASKIEEKHEELRVLERRRDEARERYNVVSGDLEEWRSEERSINDSLVERISELKDIERRLESLSANIERLRERIFSEWEVDVDQADDVVRVEYEATAADREIRDIRGKIKALGPVNQGIMEDFEEEKKRLLEVEKQFDDLDRARASLERTIHKLDIIARERFMETFHKIQKNFQEVFSRLMHDGGTKLTLEEGVDPLEAEIEVNARPTGKKMRGVRALSGGERALTAVSLLFAIYMEKPSPYCVLDEVDGPLDDANIGRFMELLRHFSMQTQFILVTHNKRTMASADMLYGVTQEIKGISRIASVKLDDAVGFAL